MSEDDRQTSKMMDTVGNKVTNGVAMATARSAEFQVEAYRDGLNKQQKHAEFLTNKINAGLAGMNSTIAKLVEFNDNIYEITEPRIYYGVETNSTVVTNTKNKTEYDYTDNDGIEHIYNYTGNSGIQVGFFDRLILGIFNTAI